MNNFFDTVVVGGGVVGLSAALALAQRGQQVALIDAGYLQGESLVESTRVYAINEASILFFKRLGVWESIEQHGIAPYEKMHIWDSVTNATIDFDSRYEGRAQLGYIINENVLKKALLSHIDQHVNVEKLSNKTITQAIITPDGLKVGTTEECWLGRMTLIADGANSPTRRLLNIPLTTWPYHQQAIVATVRTTLSHQNTAFQRFTATGTLAFLPLNNNQRSSIVWATNPAHANTLMHLSDEQFNAVLREAFEHKLGKVQLVSVRQQFPLHMRHTQHYTGEHWLLMGDAAHTIHPLAGLGLNMGLADVVSWLRIIDSKGRNTSSNLARYQRERRYATWQLIALMDMIKLVFISPLRPIVWLRGLGLTTCDKLIPLKRLFIRYAEGKQD